MSRLVGVGPVCIAWALKLSDELSPLWKLFYGYDKHRLLGKLVVLSLDFLPSFHAVFYGVTATCLYLTLVRIPRFFFESSVQITFFGASVSITYFSPLFSFYLFVLC